MPGAHHVPGNPTPEGMNRAILLLALAGIGAYTWHKISERKSAPSKAPAKPAKEPTRHKPLVTDAQLKAQYVAAYRNPNVSGEQLSKLERELYKRRIIVTGKRIEKGEKIPTFTSAASARKALGRKNELRRRAKAAEARGDMAEYDRLMDEYES